MLISIHKRNGLAEAARTFNDRTWLQQGTWSGSFLWFAAILEGFSEDWTGQVLNRNLAIRDYACIGQSHGAQGCFIGALTFAEIRHTLEDEFSKYGVSYFHDYGNRCENNSGQWLQFSRELGEQGDKLDTLPNSELARLLDIYFSFLKKSGAFMDTIIVLADVLGDLVGKQIDDLLRRSKIDDPLAYGRFLAHFLEAPLPTNVVRAEGSLRELALRVKQSTELSRLFLQEPASVAGGLKTAHRDIYLAVERHQAEFGWLNTYSFSGQPHSIDEVIQFIQDKLEDLSSPASSEASLVAEGSQTETLIKNLSVPDRIRELLEVVRLLTYVNSAKDDAHQISWQLVQPLMRAIARRISCELSDLTLNTPGELVSALDTLSLDHHNLRLRAENWALLKIEEVLHVVQGDEDVGALRHAMRLALPKGARILVGTPVVAGRIQGRARLVYTSSDCDRVNPGDVLVVTNTNPNFIPAMRRAAAVVTDTGNLICHAVIAAREFRTPCVISTRIATQVINDGEWLEVDGAIGTVTRLDLAEEVST